jgi:hypothetical protein
MIIAPNKNPAHQSSGIAYTLLFSQSFAILSPEIAKSDLKYSILICQ